MRPAIDLTNKPFGKLTVVQKYGDGTGNNTQWLCHCACGGERVCYGHNLRSGQDTHCGCMPRRNTDDLTDKPFGDLVVVRRLKPVGANARWLCRCVCGNEIEAYAWNLRSGNTKQCKNCRGKRSKAIEPTVQKGDIAQETSADDALYPGRRIGKFEVIGPVRIRPGSWEIECKQCGEVTMYTASEALHGKCLFCDY